LSDSVWADTLEHTRQVETLVAFQRLERQIVTHKSNLLKMRQSQPGKSKRTRSDRRIKDSPDTTIWKGSGVVVSLQELLDIGKMDGMLNGCVINELLQWILAGKSGEAGLSPHPREGVVMWSTREWSTLSAEYDKFLTSPGDRDWAKFRDLIRRKTEFQIPKDKHTWMVCCPILVRVHWVWVVDLLEERVIIILDPLKSHTGAQAHRQIVDKMWHWREAVITNSSSPRDPPPIVPALEEQRRVRVEGALEQGVSGSPMGPSKKSWVGIVWRVHQQRDGVSCGIYLLTTAIVLTRGWSLRDTISSEKSWLSKVRAWFLKVSLSNTFRAPLGPCTRCE
jgi:hypothetical protein